MGWHVGEGIRLVVDGEWTSYRTGQGLPDDRIWTFYEDTAGRVWVGSRDGVVVFNPDDSRTVYTKDNSPLASTKSVSSSKTQRATFTSGPTAAA